MKKNGSMWSIWLLLFMALSFLPGCSRLGLDKVLPDKRTKYQTSTSLPDLEVPPDLTLNTEDDVLRVPGDDSAMTLTEYQRAQMARNISSNEKERFFDIAGNKEGQWLRLRSFWQQQGFTLDLDDQDLGILETTWKEEADTDTEMNYRYKFRVFAESASNSANVLQILVSGEAEQWGDGTWVSNDENTQRINDINTAFERYLNADGEAEVPSS